MATQEIGDTSNYTTLPTSFIRYFPITPSLIMAISKVGINSEAAHGNVRLATYTDLAGLPYSLIHESSSTALVLNWNDLGFSVGPNEVFGAPTAQLWLAAQNDTSTAVWYRKIVADGGQWQSQAYGAFPAIASPSSAYGAVLNMRVTYNPLNAVPSRRGTRTILAPFLGI